MIDDLVRKIKSVKNNIEEALPLIDNEIQYIIRNKNQSSQTIEKILDTLLDYGQLGIGAEEFKKLNNYYASFNPTDAKYYTDSYKELYED